MYNSLLIVGNNYSFTLMLIHQVSHKIVETLKEGIDFTSLSSANGIWIYFEKNTCGRTHPFYFIVLYNE